MGPCAKVETGLSHSGQLVRLHLTGDGKGAAMARVQKDKLIRYSQSQKCRSYDTPGIMCI